MSQEDFQEYLEKQAAEFMEDVLKGKIDASELDRLYSRYHEQWENDEHEKIKVYSYSKIFSFHWATEGHWSGVENWVPEQYYLTSEVPNLEELEKVMLGDVILIDCDNDDEYNSNFLLDDHAITAFIFFYLQQDKNISKAVKKFVEALSSVAKKFRDDYDVDLYDDEGALFDRIYKAYKKQQTQT